MVVNCWKLARGRVVLHDQTDSVLRWLFLFISFSSVIFGQNCRKITENERKVPYEAKPEQDGKVRRTVSLPWRAFLPIFVFQVSNTTALSLAVTCIRNFPPVAETSSWERPIVLLCEPARSIASCVTRVVWWGFS